MSFFPTLHYFIGITFFNSCAESFVYQKTWRALLYVCLFLVIQTSLIASRGDPSREVSQRGQHAQNTECLHYFRILFDCGGRF